jgi:hypothetical protein
MKTLHLVYFLPAQARLELYFSEDGFNDSRSLPLTDLPEDKQAIVQGALAYRTSTLPPGFDTIDMIILERLPDAPLTFTEAMEETPAEPLTWTAVFEDSTSFRGPKGVDSVLSHSIPGPVTEATAGLWDYLATQIQED